MSTPQVAILTALPQDSLILHAVVDRLLANQVNFTGYRENRIPTEFSPALLEARLLLLDNGSLDRLTAEQLAAVERFALEKHVCFYDLIGNDPNNRTVINNLAEISVNGALAYSGVHSDGADMPAQDLSVTLDFVAEYCRDNLQGNPPFNEFTLHNLRGLECIAESRFGNGSQEYLDILTALFSRQNEQVIPPNHDVLGGWSYAYRHYQLSGERRFADAMLRLLDRTIAARPRTAGGLLGGAGFQADPLGRQCSPSGARGSHLVRGPGVYTELLQFHGGVLAAAAAYSGDEKYLHEAMRLVRYLREHHCDPQDHLPWHFTLQGQSRGSKWGRGAAHILWGLDLMLRFFPEMPAACREEVLAWADYLGEGLLACQRPDGLWHNILDQKASAPETSCTMCFLAVYSRLLNQGWLPVPKYRSMLRRAGQALLRMCYRGGFAENCSGTGFALNHDYYIRRPHNFRLSGQLALALVEADRLFGANPPW
ncbi:MAG: hypothetical protein GX564_10665 [Oligosphaeraceae bacterium]|nr:hypothetical protein [Oligosphaeraceae bacterium]